jgi:cell division protein ZapA
MTSKAAAGGIDVQILGRPFRIQCSEEEKVGLLKAVDFLDAKMLEIRADGKVIGNERIAIMAALNIAHEYLSTRIAPGFEVGEFRRRMKSMASSIDSAMTAQDELFD